MQEASMGDTPKVIVPFIASSYPLGGSDPTIVSSALRAFQWCHSRRRGFGLGTCTYGKRDWHPLKRLTTVNAPWQVWTL